MSDILMLIPYGKLFPPQNGGALRCFYLLRELATYYRVHCILLQHPSELTAPIDEYHFPENVIVYSPAKTPPPKTIFNYLPKRLNQALHYRWLRRQWHGSASSLLLDTHHLLSDIFKHYYVEAVIYEHLPAMATAPYIRRIATKNFVGILDAHNVEHVLMDQESVPALVREQTYWHESNLTQFVNAFFACSEHDRRLLEKINHNSINGFTIPNGVDTLLNKFDDTADKHNNQEILFCGSLDWPPNKEGLLWFYSTVWPLIQKEIPSTRLNIVGRRADKELIDSFQNDRTVNFIGYVSDVKPYYKQSGIAIAPLHAGSGTRLKILEAMSLGNPIVSTRLGAQGIDAADGESILYADNSEEFATAVLQLLTTPALFDRIRHTARSLVTDKYDWQVIGKQASDALDHILNLPTKQ